MSKRALLIASPYGELRGTINDAKSIDKVLRKQGFEITECYGEQATRAGILEAWENLIAHTSPTDAVVVYYSGHGGLVQAPEQTTNSDALGRKPKQHRFIVPIDYGETSPWDFRGILDVEISYMLKNTTQKTHNVTVIMDCSHSGTMLRDEVDSAVRTKNLPHLQYHDVVKHIDQLEYYQLSTTEKRESFLLGNPHVVRITASATTEAACEHITSCGEWGGALTDALTRAIAETEGLDTSWRTILLRVRHLVNTRHSLQHPQVEGPDTRIQFSLRHTTSGALCLKVIDEQAMLQAGSLLGVKKGNVYIIVPFDVNEADDPTEKPVEATIRSVSAFKAQADLSLMPRWRSIRHEGAFAFLKHEDLHEQQQPVEVPGSLDGLRNAVLESKYLRLWEPEEAALPLVGFHQDNHSMILRNREGVRIASQEMDNEQASSNTFYDIVAHAERLARAQRVRDLRCSQDQHRLRHSLTLEIGTVVNGGPGVQFNLEGCENNLTETDTVYFNFSNDGKQTVYVSLFNINVTGHITFLTEIWPLGIELQEGDNVLLGSDDFGDLIGSEVSWPSGISKDRSVQEEFLFILSSSPMDLRCLAESFNHDPSVHRDAQGFTSTPVLYDIIHVPFSLNPLPEPKEDIVQEVEVTLEAISTRDDETKDAILASNIPSPDVTPEREHIPSFPAAFASKVNLTNRLNVLGC